MNSAARIDLIKAWLGTGSINIFGRPFAGKDSQGRRLADLLNAPLLGGGEILRQGHMPEHIKELHRSGKLFPTDIYLEVVLPYLARAEFKGKPLILSAVGRWHGEESGVLEATTAAGHPLKAVIYLDLEESKIWQRWEFAQQTQDRGERVDDTKETLQTRLEEFRDKTLPVLDFYRQKGLLIELSGSQSLDDVTKSILDALVAFSKSSP